MESAKKYMKAVVLTGPSQYEYSATVKEIPVPQNGQVLIRVECGVINPTDTYFLAGKYHGQYSYPLVPGIEGSGTVIQSGGGFYGWTMVGKRVAFVRQNERPGLFSKDGSYAEYCVTSATNCIALDDNISFEQGASGIANPLTALGLLEKIKEHKATAVIQTAAYSQMGRMMIRLCRENRIPIINIVRKEDQVTLLQEKYA